MADAPDTSVIDTELNTPLAAGGGMFCGVSMEEYAIGGHTYQWPRGSRLKWGIAFSRLGELSDMDVKDAFTLAFKEIADCCDVSHEYVSNPGAANIKITQQRLDGASGVLADCQIPVGNVSTDQTQLLMRLDDSEAWGMYENPPNGRIDLYRVILHELEHGHGLGHKPASIQVPALISPVYSPTMRHLQKADVDEFLRRYGSPKIAPAPPATGKSVNYKGLQEISQMGANGKLMIWRGEVSGELQRVQ